MIDLEDVGVGRYAFTLTLTLQTQTQTHTLSLKFLWQIWMELLNSQKSRYFAVSISHKFVEIFSACKN